MRTCPPSQVGASANAAPPPQPGAPCLLSQRALSCLSHSFHSHCLTPLFVSEHLPFCPARLRPSWALSLSFIHRYNLSAAAAPSCLSVAAFRPPGIFLLFQPKLSLDM